jgi:hypothetical protein
MHQYALRNELLRQFTEVRHRLKHSEKSKSKLKVSLVLIKHHAMHIYERVEVQLHAILTSALDGGQSLASHLGRFPPKCTGQEAG